MSGEIERCRRTLRYHARRALRLAMELEPAGEIGNAVVIEHLPGFEPTATREADAESKQIELRCALCFRGQRDACAFAFRNLENGVRRRESARMQRDLERDAALGRCACDRREVDIEVRRALMC